MIRRRSSKGVNPTMASIMAVFQIAWIYYGLLILSRPVIVWNVIGMLTNSVTIWAHWQVCARRTGRHCRPRA